MSYKRLITWILLPGILAGCVSQKKFNKMKAEADERYVGLNNTCNTTQASLKKCNDNFDALAREKSSLESEMDELKKRTNFLKENNTTMLKQLEGLSVVTSTQAESIKRSLENIGAKDEYIQDLQKEMDRKDSLNMALVMNLKGAIGNLDDKDINIKVDKGVVFVDISDKLLFTSGKYDIKPHAHEVLRKVAMVLKNQSHLEFMVEGHTDDVAYHHPPLLDNWDLSVKRATSVVRVLQKEYGLEPTHITAAGRGEFISVASNDTPEGRSANRRTRIVILPQLDQFFQLLEPR